MTAQTAGSQLGLTSAYIGQMQGYGTAPDIQTNLNNTIIASKTAAIKATSGIDDVAMLAQETDLQVRQQAAVSMMAQAHLSQYYLGRLYGGGTSS